ncbi:MAG: gliding motility-associated C-terminal domain-containing protein [Psychroserpens sp.]
MLLLLLNLKGFAQVPAVFNCDATALYQTIKIEQDIAGVGSDGDMIFYSVDPATGAFQFVSNLSVDDDGSANGDIAIPGNINSIGFNPIDGFIYGIDTDSSELFKISPNGFVQSLGNITGPLVNGGGKQAGVFDENGIYYVTGGSQKLYSIDLSNNPQPGDPLPSTFLFNIGKQTSDIAINPLNNLMYGWDQSNSKQLFTINLVTGSVNVIGPAAGTSQYRIFGALYFTAGGQLIGYGDDTTVGGGSNTQETLVQIDINTGVPSFIATGESVGTNDGASCPYGFELFKDAPDNVDLGQEFTYTFTIFNASGTPITGLDFTDNLMPGIVFTTNPYDITNGLSIVGNTAGLTSANLIVNDIAIGVSSFKINVTTDCSVENMVISNQATLSSDFLTVVSDDPQASGITNTTVTDIVDPSIIVPDPLVIEGCDLSVLTEDAIVFPLSFTPSGDIKEIFNTIPDYSTTAPQNIASITYVDEIIDEDSCIKVVNRAFSLTNTCGSTSITIQVINVQDSIEPTFTVPNDVTIDCSEDPSNFTLTGDVTDEADNCSENLQATFVDVINTDNVPDTCNSSYTIVRTWSLTDDCGNLTEQVQTITVEDNTAPDITFCTLNNQTLECEGALGNEMLANNWNAANIAALQNCATDDCNTNFTGLITSDYNFNKFVTDCGQSGAITVLYRISDGCGNSMELQPVTLTIVDTISPDLESCGVENTIITCSPTDNENLADAWNASNIAALETCGADECDMDLTGQVTSNYDFANLNTTCGPCGTLNVLYTVTDDCGNASSINVTLTFDDGTLPDLSNCEVIDQTVECSFTDIETIADNWDTSNISTLENCTQTFDITVTSDYDYGNLVQACGQTGSIDVIYTLTDLCGNTTVFDATFTIEDTTVPVFDGVDDAVCIAEFINGSFEANTFNGTFIQFQQEDVPGWSTTAAHNTIEIQRSGQIDGSIPFDGNYHFELNGQALDDLYQEFCTVPTSNLELSFYHKKRASSTDVDVLEVFIGADLNNLISQGLYQVSDAEGWKQNIINYTVPAGQDATIVLFQAISGTTNSIGNLLDAITVNSDLNSFGPLPEDITVECNEVPEPMILTATDNCGEATVTLMETITPGSCTNQYTIARTYTASDECGNSVSHTQIITVEDTTAPGFTQNPPSNVTVECDNIPNAPTLLADDNCGTAVVTFEEVSSPGECVFEQTIIRTWTATDECGNTSVHNQTITVEDTTAPVAPDGPEDITIEGSYPEDVPVADDLIAIDNCSGEIIATAVDTINDSDPNNVIITRTWTFTDDCDNSSTTTQIITIINDPQFTCDGTIFYQTIQINEDIVNVGSAGDFILYLVNPSGDFSFFANLSVDDDGAGTEDEALVNSINGIGFNTVDGLIYGVDSTQDILYRILPNGFVQNLGVVSGAISNSSNYSGTFDNNGTYYVLGNNGNLVSITGTADLNPGDPITSTFLYDLNVNSPDIAINPSDFKMYGWNSNTRQLFRVDLSDGSIEIIGPAANTSNYFSFGGMYFTASGQLFGYGNDTNLGTGNSQESVVQFDLTTGVPTTIGLGIEVTANDGASCAFGFELLKDAPDSVDLGQTFTYTFTIANATNDVLNDLEFVDNLVPGLVFVSDPYNITNGMTITGMTNTLTSANLEISDIPTGSSTFQIDVTTDCSIMDMVISNQATLSSEFLTVTSDDPETAGVTNTTLTSIVDPSLSVPDPLVIEGCDTSVINSDNAVFPLSTTISEDIKDIFNTVDGYTTEAPQNIVSITYIDTIVDDVSCPIIVNREFTLTNTCGIVTTTIQVINVEDTIAPVAPEAPEDTTLQCSDDLPTSMDLTAVDNCLGDITVSPVITTDDADACNIITTYTWTFVDACENTTVITQTITVSDTIDPTFTVPADISLDCDSDISDLSITGDVNDATDNCAADLEVTFTDSTSTDGDCGTSIIRTWSVTDSCGNTTEQDQAIILIDDIAPTFTVPANITLECDADTSDLSVTGDVTDESDNCATGIEATFTDVTVVGDCETPTVITRTWVLTDACENSTSQDQVISIQDTTAPTVIGEFDESITVECGEEIPDAPSLEFEDNCAETVTVEFTENTIDDIIVREWTVSDGCNEVVFTQTVTINGGGIVSVDNSTDICITDNVDLDLFDLLSGDLDTSGVWTEESGTATINGSLFNPTSLLTGDDEYPDTAIRDYTFTYTVTGICAQEIDVTIAVNDGCVVGSVTCDRSNLIISKAVTPNGDGVNDAFAISGVDSTCGFTYEVQIFNRWGAKIYDNSNYQNDWQGTTSSGSIGSSGVVPTGTYYYILTINNSGFEPIAGPLYVSTK